MGHILSHLKDSLHSPVRDGGLFLYTLGSIAHAYGKSSHQSGRYMTYNFISDV